MKSKIKDLSVEKREAKKRLIAARKEWLHKTGSGITVVSETAVCIKPDSDLAKIVTCEKISKDQRRNRSLVEVVEGTSIEITPQLELLPGQKVEKISRSSWYGRRPVEVIEGTGIAVTRENPLPPGKKKETINWNLFKKRQTVLVVEKTAIRITEDRPLLPHEKAETITVATCISRKPVTVLTNTAILVSDQDDDKKATEKITISAYKMRKRKCVRDGFFQTETQDKVVLNSGADAVKPQDNGSFFLTQ